MKRDTVFRVSFGRQYIINLFLCWWYFSWRYVQHMLPCGILVFIPPVFVFVLIMLFCHDPWEISGVRVLLDLFSKSDLPSTWSARNTSIRGKHWMSITVAFSQDTGALATSRAASCSQQERLCMTKWKLVQKVVARKRWELKRLEGWKSVKTVCDGPRKAFYDCDISSRRTHSDCDRTCDTDSGRDVFSKEMRLRTVWGYGCVSAPGSLTVFREEVLWTTITLT